ncbi:hypothetical protein [Melittangium boletus]|uniref:hypothetical protein n=1 Tax=Melittangium boletus TaxID=83453 RepID=UPI003DA5A346
MDWTATKRCRLTCMLAALLLLTHCQGSGPAAQASSRASGDKALQDAGRTPCTKSVAACDLRFEPEPELCSSGGWCLKYPREPTDAYQDAWAVDDANVLAVGSSEFILHWKGETRRYLPSGTTSVLHAVWAANGADAWAVGEAGSIVHWNGSRWSLVRSGGPTLRAVFGTGSSDVWAGGDEGLLLHWNGNQWLTVSTGTTASIRSLWASGPSDVWVSFPGLDAEGGVRRWNGQDWSLLPPVGGYVNGLWGFGPADVWVAGSQGLLAHWTGEGWHTVSGISPEDSFLRVRGFDSQRLWLVGTGLWLFDGQTLHSRQPGPLGVTLLTAVTLGSQAPLLAVGSTGMLVRHLVEDQWEVQVSSGPLVSSFRDVWASGPADAWALRDAGGLFHWDGMTWAQVQGAPSMTMHVLSGSAPSDVWVAGRMNGTYETTLAHFDGLEWRKTLYPRGETFVDIWALHENAAWVANSRGEIRRWNGQDWQMSISTGRPLRGLHGSSEDNVWAVGEWGTLLRWNGQQWINHSVAGTDFFAVWTFGPEDVWAIGGDSALWHWDGLRMLRVDVGVSTSLNALFGRGPDDLWAVGNSGVVLHWNGQTWSAVSSGTRRSLLSIWGAGPRLFSGGAGPVILQHE